jgi:hypothetical protein
VIGHYKLSKQCYLGRPKRTFEYLLAGTQTPQGEMPGESCMKFDLSNLDVDKVRDQWQLRDGNKPIRSFDREDDAWMAYAYLRRHLFSYRCNAGEVFTYFRK